MGTVAHRGDPAKFITRGQHEQNYGYARWLAQAMNMLYDNPPRSARELVENSGLLMRHKPDSPEWKQIAGEAREVMTRYQCPSHPDSEFEIFYPVVTEGYGIINQQRPAFETFASLRGYVKTLERNYGDLSHFATLEPFSYPIPGTNSRLSLMQVGWRDDLFPEYPADKRLVWRHPQLTPQRYEAFIACLEPLFDTVARDSKSSREDKENAAITFYWLMAQMTPSKRGGTAQARMVLEYLAAQCGWEIPHLREGIDLWAEAACTDLEHFRDHFHSGVFFDRNVTSDQVMQWQNELFKKQGMDEMQRRYDDAVKPVDEADYRQLEIPWLKTLNCLAKDVTQFSKNSTLAEYNGAAIQKDILLMATLSTQLARHQYPLFLEALTSRSQLEGRFIPISLDDKVWDFIKGKLQKELLPRWECQLREEPTRLGHGPYNDKLLEAVQTLKANLPGIVMKAEAHIARLDGPRPPDYLCR